MSAAAHACAERNTTVGCCSAPGACMVRTVCRSTGKRRRRAYVGGELHSCPGGRCGECFIPAAARTNAAHSSVGSSCSASSMSCTATSVVVVPQGVDIQASRLFYQAGRKFFYFFIFYFFYLLLAWPNYFVLYFDLCAFGQVNRDTSTSTQLATAQARSPRTYSCELRAVRLPTLPRAPGTTDRLPTGCDRTADCRLARLAVPDLASGCLTRRAQ